MGFLLGGGLDRRGKLLLWLGFERKTAFFSDIQHSVDDIDVYHIVTMFIQSQQDYDTKKQSLGSRDMFMHKKWRNVSRVAGICERNAWPIQVFFDNTWIGIW